MYKNTSFTGTGIQQCWQKAEPTYGCVFVNDANRGAVCIVYVVRTYWWRGAVRVVCTTTRTAEHCCRNIYPIYDILLHMLLYARVQAFLILRSTYPGVPVVYMQHLRVVSMAEEERMKVTTKPNWNRCVWTWTKKHGRGDFKGLRVACHNGDRGSPSPAKFFMLPARRVWRWRPIFRRRCNTARPPYICMIRVS